MDIAEELNYFTKVSQELLEGCKKIAFNGTILYTPDGVANYDALWTRDLGYMAEYAGDLIGAENLEACIEFVLSGQREDGWFPDRVEASGEPVYAAGAKGTPVGEANLDNTPFLVFAVSSYLKLLEVKRAGSGREKFRGWAEAIFKGMDCIPLSKDGLVWNDPERPHSPYGFTDTVCKTGRLFYESLLFWRACRQLSGMIRESGLSEEKAKEYEKKAAQVEKAISCLYDEASGMYFAAELNCRQLDIWGAAYLLYIGFPVEKRVEVGLKNWLLENEETYLYRGQVRHLPQDEYWEKLLEDVKPEEYQNGAYWATASGWVWYVFQEEAPKKAEKLLLELREDFQTGGVCECINRDYRKLPHYVVSGVNVRGPLLRYEMEQFNKRGVKGC